MLANKTKKVKNKQKKSTEDSEDNIQSMRSWVRKIEQTTNSVSSRLSAVEKRLSVRRNDPSDDPISGMGSLGKPLKKVFEEIGQGQSSSKEIVQVSQILDEEFERLNSELAAQQTEVDSIKEKIDKTNKSILEIKNEIKKTREIEAKYLTDFKSRIETLEKRAPPVMKLGNMEVPIEISGIIAGFIAIFAALFVYIGETEFLISPAFLGIVGFLFIGSAVFKSIKSR